ncbi:alcohol dehydrogenase [Histoplasma capsulatum G186AR]|uniref:Alcohol dehydrogenase n=1 Tax=Ajellomyces capsulatus (strain G186AR / H82 / ATCC MYA-2454 / RMSCC 2432) TaxID=447093 RepID=C0NTF0_AJECG|nr:alcohol dehydrogenase [Histoplasma capsulatum G186AR]EEH05311.1 alcohol dehydrogenase [Histoplasma capsulatum G186AR]
MTQPIKTDTWLVEGTTGFNSLHLRREGLYPFPMTLPRVPCSDSAGIVLSTGPRVVHFRRGDRVCTLFNQTHQSNPITRDSMSSGLGGTLDGTLRKYAVLPETGLVMAPSNLSPIAASTLSCAPLTAWNALYGLTPLKPGDVVLTQGTGGVSLAAIQFAVAAGAMVVATTSSEEKALRLKKMGVQHVINYKTTPEWGEVARSYTRGGRGVDHVIEVGGPGTMAESLKAVRKEGIITVIGFLGGTGGKGEKEPSILDPLVHICTVRGIFVGSRQQMEDMVRAIQTNNIQPVVDEKVFTFENAKEAYQYQWDQKHFGKVVINVQDAYVNGKAIRAAKTATSYI